MDEIVMEQYRKLAKSGFKNAGLIDDPTMFIDSKAEGISICGQGGLDYMNIYIKAVDGIITDIRYLCSCDPPANVVVEVLCDLVKDRTLEQAKALSKEEFFQVIGSDGGGVRRKVWGIIELLNRVIYRYEVRLVETRKAVISH